MKKKIEKILLAFLFLGSFTVLGINYQQTSRSNSLTYEKLEDSRTYNGLVHNDYKWIVTLGGSYVNAPLVVKTKSNKKQLEEVISGMYGLHLGVGYYFKPWLMLGAVGTYNKFKDNNRKTYRGFSDPELRLKLRLVNKKRWGLSLIPFASMGLKQGRLKLSNLQYVPSMNGVEVSPISDLGHGWGLKVAWEYLLDKVQLIVNLGYKNSDHAIERDSLGNTQVDYRQVLLTGIGAYIPIRRTWGINIEYLRHWSFDLFNNDQEQNELFVGMGAGLTQSLHLYGGLGMGNLFSDHDGNDYRVSLGLKYVGYGKASPRKPLAAVVMGDNCSVFNGSDRITIRFRTNDFGFDSHNAPLMRLAKLLKKNKDKIERVYVDGHTSKAGKASYNLSLSQKRAEQAVAFFSTQGGLPKKIFTPRGFGELAPIDLSDKGDEKSLGALANRRVEVKVKCRGRK